MCVRSAARLRGVLTQSLYILVSQSELSYLRFHGGYEPRAVGHCCVYSVLLESGQCAHLVFPYSGELCVHVSLSNSGKCVLKLNLFRPCGP